MMNKFADTYLPIPLSQGIILQRDTTGKVSTNIPHLIVHHSPSGFEFGYSGSGPSDLALNIIEAILRAENFIGQQVDAKLFNGKTCFYQSWRLHQHFKRDFIAGMHSDPGIQRIEYTDALAWIRASAVEEPEPIPQEAEEDV